MVKTSLLVLGSFCIAYNLSQFLHELGHAISAWLFNGSVAAILLNPFSGCWTFYHDNPNPLFSAWGGVLFGVLLSLAITGIACWVRSPWMTPFYMLGGCSLAVNGIYLSVAAFASMGDSEALVEQGVPLFCVVGIGLFLLSLSCLWTSAIQSLIGISSETSFGLRLATLHLGVTPYLVTMLAYVAVYSKTEVRLFLGFVGAGAVAITAIAALGHLVRKTVAFPRLAHIETTWTSSIVVLAVGIAVIAAELLCFDTYSGF